MRSNTRISRLGDKGGNHAFPRRTFSTPGALPLTEAGCPPSPDHRLRPRGCTRRLRGTAPQCARSRRAARHTPRARPAKTHSAGPGTTREAARGRPPRGCRATKRGVQEEKASGRAPRSWVRWPRAAADPRPSPSAPNPSGRRRSSRPPPPPPATPGSWQRPGQRRVGERRRPPPRGPRKEPKARCLQPHHLRRNEPAAGSFLAMAPFPPGLFRFYTGRRMRAGKGGGG